jgi:ABC-type nitrate/sulfonate/bicarbonate transport system substrate-binding protein
MIELKVGGVPEHFNLPWHLAVEAGVPQRVGVGLTWRDYPDGSGAMAAALRAGELDAALLLTEGAVAGVASGGGFRIASLYTESSLIWGIHVPAASRFMRVADIRGARYAISRLGSGSHLMAFVHARSQGWPVDTLELVTVRNLAGAVEAFATGAADVFFWEKFMTKPLVDAGRFRRVGEFLAPWPAFVLCVADGVGAPQRAALRTLLAAVLDEAKTLAARADAPAVIGRRYSLEPADVAEWLRATRWAREVAIEPSHLVQVTTALQNLGLVPSEFEPTPALLPLGGT